MSRRQFVGIATVAGVTAVTMMSTGCARATSSAKSVVTPSTTYGKGGTMSKRVLVGYSTRNGSTVGVAEKIGQALGDKGLTVDVRPLGDRPSVSDYDAVVLGSAVNGGNWLPEALDYVRGNRTPLAGVPVAMFCVHAMNCGTDERETAKRMAYLDEARSVIRPSAEGFFAGKGPSPEDTNWLALWAFRAFGGHVVEGDGRDWDKIASWAQSLDV